MSADIRGHVALHHHHHLVILKQNEAQSACAESTNKGVNERSKDVIQPESPAVCEQGLLFLKGRDGIFNVRNDLSEYGCAHESETGTGVSAQALTWGVEGVVVGVAGRWEG